MKTKGRMVRSTEGGFFPANIVGEVVGSDASECSLILPVGTISGQVLRMRDEHLVYVEQRWVECEDQS